MGVSVLVLGLTGLSIARAFAIVTVANALRTTLTVPAAVAGTPGESASIAVGKWDSPVKVMGSTLTPGMRFTGEAVVTVSSATPVVLTAAGTTTSAHWNPYEPLETNYAIGVRYYGPSDPRNEFPRNYNFLATVGATEDPLLHDTVFLQIAYDGAGKPTRMKAMNESPIPVAVVIVQIW